LAQATLAQTNTFRISLTEMPITLEGTPTILNKQVQWLCDVTQDLWTCIPDHLDQSSTRLQIQTPLSIGTRRQDRHQNVINSYSPNDLSSSGNSIDREMFLSMRRKASASTPEQQLFKTALLQVRNMRNVAAKQNGRKPPQPTPVCCKKEASLRSVSIEKSCILNPDRVAVMAELPPVKVMDEDGSSRPTSIGNLSSREQLPTMADILTDDTLPIFE